MLPKHFYAMVDGHYRKEYKRESALRMLGFLTLLPHSEKGKLSFHKMCTDIWPLSLDEEFIEEEKGAAHPLQDLSAAERKRKFLEIMHKHNPKRYPSPETTTT